MDVKSAAIQVLQQAGTALNAKDITEKIIAAGLWSSDSKGKIPSATVGARRGADPYACGIGGGYGTMPLT